MIPSLGLSTPNQTLFSALSAQKTQAALQAASSGDLVQLGDEARDPAAPNINPSNALEAIDALLLGFTPTHTTVNFLA